MSFGKRWKNLNPYELHKTLINEYFLTGKNKVSLLKRDSSKDKRDIDVIRENHKFLWEEEEGSLSWEKKLAKKYYDKLYKEYCVGDLSKYKENKIGLRWRTEQELVEGKGQFSCGSKRCSEKDDLRTWEVNFGYVEHGVKKNALVKLRLCQKCSYKLNYHHKKKEVKRLKHNHVKGKEESEVQRKEREVEERRKGDDERSETVDSGSPKTSPKTDDVWKHNPVEEELESNTREEEFDKYLHQLFLSKAAKKIETSQECLASSLL